MKTFNRYLWNYLIYALPIVIATVIWSSFQSDQVIRAAGSPSLTALWEVMSWTLMLWFVALGTFMVLLVFRRDTQESSIQFLAGIRERDEREQAIVGLAARRSFVATTALLIFLLFASCFTINLARSPNETADGKRSTLSLGFQFSGSEVPKPVSQDGVVFEHHDIPLSKSALLLIVLVWHVGAFRFKFRRDLGEV